jgi:thioredoxin 1
MHDISNTHVQNATDATLRGLVARSDVPTLVDFWAPWCGPCRLLAPVLDRIAQTYEGRVQVLSVNVDDNRSSSAAYDIRSIPTLILFRGGEATARVVGVVPATQLGALLDDALAATETAGGR